jgi:hypothetical protein
MGIKSKPGRFDCLDRTKKSSQCLLARDPAVATLVETWANMRTELISSAIGPIAMRRASRSSRHVNAPRLCKYHGELRAKR